MDSSGEAAAAQQCNKTIDIEVTRTITLPDMPCEVQLMIYDYLGPETATLASLARTCKGTHEAANDTLYNNITVIGDDLKLRYVNINASTCKLSYLPTSKPSH